MNKSACTAQIGEVLSGRSRAIVNRMATCCTCGKLLDGRKRRFCSRRCKNADSNRRNQSYAAQQSRGRARKLELIGFFGSCCSRCGYRGNYSALEFHHVDPSRKSFSLDLRSLSNRRWLTILQEARKCILVCSNCHKEIHNPEASLDSLS